MILVDSSVWIDYFRGDATPGTTALDDMLGREQVIVGDLILAEILQGFDTEAQAARAERLLGSLETIELGGRDAAVAAAASFRALRRAGVTVRKTIDTLIASCCIREGHVLLHNDRDFDAFETHLGLRVLRVT